MAILVTGGAGYIGANFIHQYLELEPKCQLIILDDLSTGDPSRISAKTIFYKGDFADLDLLKTIFTKYKIDSLVHFAAKTSVEESFEQAQIYHLENYLKTKELFDFCSSNGTKNIIFSSTAAVYASQTNGKISEQGPTNPKSPYGVAKLKAELYLQELQKKCSDLNFIILRYFNVAGANLSKNLGPNSKSGKHLFKMTAQAAAGHKSSFPIFGIDYPTRDGTCIRDFIHVMDIANAHIASLNYLKTRSECLVLNCGYGKGYSVREVAEIMYNLAPNKFQILECERRKGDIPVVIADNSKLIQNLDWEPQHSNIEEICRSALTWEIKARGN